jgi:CheY-like chemotaxis protein
MKRVLIVDDARELGRLLQTVFLTLDPTLTINVVPSAEEALLMSTKIPVDLLVSDIRLPGISGLELVRKIRTRHPDIKVLLITGMTEPSMDDFARQLHVEGFFRKPLDMGSFLDATRRCLDISADTPLTPLGGLPEVYEAGLPHKTGPLPSLPAEPADLETPRVTLSEIVVGLRQRVGAAAIFILDERGRIVAQAGDAPELPLETEWAAPVMAVLSAGSKVSRLVGDETLQHAMAFPGKDYHLVLAPAGDYALLVLVHPGRSALRMAVAVEEALEAQQALREVLPGIPPKLAELQEAGATVEPHPPSTAPLPEIQPEDLEAEPMSKLDSQSLVDFEALLSQSEEELKDKDVDAFWETLASQGQPGPAANPDALSYDQARKLGLAPEEE